MRGPGPSDLLFCFKKAFNFRGPFQTNPSLAAGLPLDGLRAAGFQDLGGARQLGGIDHLPTERLVTRLSVP